MGKVYTKPGGGSSDLSFVTAVAGDIVSGKVGASAVGEPVNGSLSLSGNAAASDVASGKTFYTTNPKSKQTGTLVERGQYQTAGGWGSGGSGADAYFAMNRIPEGIYRANGADWAPEIRMKQTDVRAAIGATNAANWRSNTTIAGLKGSMPEQGGKTVTPTASTQTVVSAGRYVTGDIKVAGVSGLPDVRPNTKQTFQDDDCKVYAAINRPSTISHKFECSYSKVKLNIKIAFKNKGFTDIGDFIVNQGEYEWSARCNCFKFFLVRISDGSILENISGIKGTEMADALIGISFTRISGKSYICLGVDVDNWSNINGDFPFKAEITILEAWN